MDSNLDAFLDADELATGTMDAKKMIVKRLIPAFDLNQDGRLSLNEYRLTPRANMVLYWLKELTDADNDRRLSFAEFSFDSPQFPILRLIFFRRFDRNQDGYLDLDEYDFKVKRPREMHRLNEDGSGRKQLNLGTIMGTNYMVVGSPAVSPDGKTIAFDGQKRVGGGNVGWQILTVEIDGGEPKEICHGVQPTWSADGSRIACTQHRPVSGPWIIDLAGQDNKHIAEGRGAQWSPDGKQIFYMDLNEMVLKLYDVESEETTLLLDREECEYPHFEFNAAWSPDSKRICVKANKGNDDCALVIIDVTGTEKDKVKIRHTAKRIGADSAWSPNGRRLVFSMFSEERKRMQFYEVDPDTMEPPKYLAGQPENVNAVDVTWTPDGKHLIITTSDE